MKSILYFILALSFMACNSQSAPGSEETTVVEQQQEEYENIDSDEMVKKMEKEPGILLDVRTPEETREGMIEGAMTMDYYEDDFQDRVTELDRDKPVYVYCASGKRSGETAEMLKDAGFSEVYNLEGGIIEWEESGKPVAEGK